MNTDRASHHFLAQRISAIILIPLVIWFCLSLARLPEANYETTITWIKSPINTLLLLLLIIVSLRHAILGLQVIIEDYISDVSKRNNLIRFVKILSYALMAAGVFSIIKITLGGS